MGRPTKLTAEVQARLVEAISAGSYYEVACAYAGVDYSTFRRWMERGEESAHGRFREFCDAMQAAEAKAELRMVMYWSTQAGESWQAARDFLARRFPDRWAPKERAQVEVSGPGGGPIQITEIVAVLSPVDLEDA